MVDGPVPAVDADGQLNVDSGIVTHTGEDLDGNDLWRCLS